MDKIKREVVVRPRDEGGLGLFSPANFLLSMKVTLIFKLIDDMFCHKWKDIALNQLLHPGHPVISIENGLVGNKTYSFMADLLCCFAEWKKARAEACDSSINHCIWGNHLITDIGAKLWNDYLINRGLLYLSDFLSEDNQVLNYNSFISKHHISTRTITPSIYLNIKMAIRRYDCPAVTSKSLAMINQEINLSSINNKYTKIKGGTIRGMMTKAASPNELSALKSWSTDIKRTSIDWQSVFIRLYGNFTNNYKLLQFQYKLMLRISTSRYMRFKMGIDREGGTCSLCELGLETLSHIFMECPNTTFFVTRINNFIKDKIDPDYKDPNRYFFITCCYSNNTIDFLNLCAKWYISRSFQGKKKLVWEVFLSQVRFCLVGEKRELRESLESLL